MHVSGTGSSDEYEESTGSLSLSSVPSSIPSPTALDDPVAPPTPAALSSREGKAVAAEVRSLVRSPSETAGDAETPPADGWVDVADVRVPAKAVDEQATAAAQDAVHDQLTAVEDVVYDHQVCEAELAIADLGTLVYATNAFDMAVKAEVANRQAAHDAVVTAVETEVEEWRAAAELLCSSSLL